MIPTSTIPEAHRVIQPHETKTPSISTSHPSGKSRVQRANLAKSTVTIRQMTNSVPPQHRPTLTAHPAIPGKKNRLNLHVHGYSEALATKTTLIIVEAIRHRREAVNLEQILVLAITITAGEVPKNLHHPQLLSRHLPISCLPILGPNRKVTTKSLAPMMESKQQKKDSILTRMKISIPTHIHTPRPTLMPPLRLPSFGKI
mmetsp:Transcript_6141/g.12076  ORF Transcript_6141/g.12076 Transcript_6141/m.12076 type:complete len:201 (+) Transcript_6141:158-760(+)